MFPTIVYRCPGPHFGPPHTTYNSVGVNDEDEFVEHLASGWYASLAEAVEAFLNPAPVMNANSLEPVTVEPDVEPGNDDAPPTREEMMEQAAKLNMQVDKRWSDATLLKKIIEAMP